MVIATEKIIAESAGELLSQVHNLLSMPAMELGNGIIFRGVGDFEKYKLIPAALREGELEKLENIAGLDEKYRKHLSDSEYQIYLEYEVARKFAMKADMAGLHIPTASSKIHNTIVDMYSPDNSDITEEILTNWPHPDFIPILALAQHYGVPTRLLDWTFDPMVALFFAAKSAFQKCRANNEVKSIFGIYIVTSLNFDDSKRFSGSDLEFKIQVAIPPRHVNPFMNAQSGLFTYITGSICNNIDLIKIPTDELHYMHLIKEDDSSNFYFIGLESSFAEELLFLLGNYGYDETRIFPGYEGVAKSLLRGSR